MELVLFIGGFIIGAAFAFMFMKVSAGGNDEG